MQKKTLISAAAAVSLTFALVACAPPNEQDSSQEHIDTATTGPKTPALNEERESPSVSDSSESSEVADQDGMTGGFDGGTTMEQSNADSTAVDGVTATTDAVDAEYN